MSANDLASDEARKSFKTYLLFLTDLTEILLKSGQKQSDILRQLFREQESLLVNVKRKQLSAAESDRIRKMLYNGWNSELAARLSGQLDKSLLTVTNQWKPIQAYYASYFLLAPLRMVMAQGGFDALDTHEKNLTFATNNICIQLPRPWRCRYHVEDRRWSSDFPKPPALGRIGWNLARNRDSYDHFANFLRTTGEHKREEKWTKIKSQKRQKKKDLRLGYISFWDALWRFRRWANYLEAQHLLEGQDSESAREFDRNLNLVLMCTMGVLERCLSAHLSKEFMGEAYADYLSTLTKTIASEDVAKHLTVRRDLICVL
jgi:hypothetical protein